MSAGARGVYATCPSCGRNHFYTGRTVEQIAADPARSGCAACQIAFKLEQRPAPEMRPDQRAVLTTRQLEDSRRLLESALGGSEDDQ